MTVAELIIELQKIEDKSRIVLYSQDKYFSIVIHFIKIDERGDVLLF